MSAFVVEDKTINQVVDWLEYYSRESGWLLRRLSEDHHIGGCNWKHELGSLMFLLNTQAVEARYGEGEAKSFRPLNYQYHPTGLINPYQVYKSLQCWLYQCTEGDIPTTPLFEFIGHEVRIALADSLIMKRPEYDLARWT